jgi:NADH-quinone oxidoreductase subunit J
MTFAAVVFFSENSIHSVFSLLILIIFSSCLLVMVFGVEFLAIACIMVYAGAIVVIFLFVIISADLRREDTIIDTLRLKRYNFVLFFCFIFFGLFLNCFFVESQQAFDFFNEYSMSVTGNQQAMYQKLEFANDITGLGGVFYHEFFLFFLLLGFLLCTSMVASISLCFKPLNTYGCLSTPT